MGTTGRKDNRARNIGVMRTIAKIARRIASFFRRAPSPRYDPGPPSVVIGGPSTPETLR